jgi:hypothetical protein
MSKNKKTFKDQEIVQINSAKRIERWHLCQQIGVVYYESQASFDKLQQIKDYIERRGVLD